MTMDLSSGALAPVLAAASTRPDIAINLACRLFGFTAPREIIAGTVWLLGNWRRRHAVYYVTNPAAVCPMLQTDPGAVFLYGSADRIDLPPACARRGRALAQIVDVGEDGTPRPVTEEFNRLFPARTAGLRRGAVPGKQGVFERVPAWTLLMADWYGKLRDEKRMSVRKPSWAWITEWFAKHAPAAIRGQPPALDTLKHDIARMRKVKPNDPVAWLSGQFLMFWEHLEQRDEYFVLHQSGKTLAEIVREAARLNAAPPPEMLPREVNGRRVHEPIPA